VAHRVAALGGTAALVLGTVCTAYAATGSPPVTTADVITMNAGDAMEIDVTANDKDPDGDQLEVCRLGPLPRALRESFVTAGKLVVATDRRAHGSHSLTYYACDDSYLSAGTLTVHVKPPRPTIDVIPVGDAPPGRLRLVNTYKNKTFHCQWGPLDSDEIEGRAVVRPGSTKIITVHEARLHLDCEGPHVGLSAIFDRPGQSLVTREVR
jgi:hypothetical protein